MDGTIRSLETKQVLQDILIREGVSRGLYEFKGSTLNMLIGARQVSFSCAAGLSFYALQKLVGRVEQAIKEQATARQNRNQIDIE